MDVTLGDGDAGAGVADASVKGEVVTGAKVAAGVVVGGGVGVGASATDGDGGCGASVGVVARCGGGPGCGRSRNQPAAIAKTTSATSARGAPIPEPEPREDLLGTSGLIRQSRISTSQRCRIERMQIDGRTFLISGGSSGLGAACVTEFARSGANVLICDVSERGDELAGELGPSVCFARTDVTVAAQVQSAVDTAAEKFGALHGAINCAGIATAERVIGRDGPQPLEHFTKVVTVNLIGTFNVIRLAAAKMLERSVEPGEDRGVIVCTASVAAFDGQIGQAAYAASKGGVVGLTLPVAREFAQHQIRVMSIAPGIFDTPMLAGLPEAARESLGKQVPFPSRLGKPAEYALLARHIVENQMLNGEIIRLDGAIRMAPR